MGKIALAIVGAFVLGGAQLFLIHQSQTADKNGVKTNSPVASNSPLNSITNTSSADCTKAGQEVNFQIKAPVRGGSPIQVHYSVSELAIDGEIIYPQQQNIVFTIPALAPSGTYQLVIYALVVGNKLALPTQTFNVC